MFNLSEASLAADQLAQTALDRSDSRLSPYSMNARSQIAADVSRALRLRSSHLRGSLRTFAQALADRLHDSHSNTAASPR